MLAGDTIAAIATSVGDAGIGIVRLSGPDAFSLAQKMFRKKNGQNVLTFENRKMMYGNFVDPARGTGIDEGLLVYMPAPHSYTCEDVVEFQIHGGSRVLQNMLTVLLENGARMALPGEFTQRAFLNGRIDLTQAEAVMDLITAKTESSLKNAANHLSGELSRKISQIRRELLDFLSGVEAALDYPEEDLPPLELEQANEKLSTIRLMITELLSTARSGRILRDGLHTVIAGRPNVGKSSLLNLLLGVERALVTEVPGTTRDSIEEYLNLRGIPLRIIDTAGLRNTEDRVERLGIQRARAAIDNAALVFFLMDASEPLSTEDEEIYAALPEVPVVVVVNKTDLPVRLDVSPLVNSSRHPDVVYVSAKEGTGLDKLADVVENFVYDGKAPLSEAAWICNARHEESLRLAGLNIDAALEAIRTGMPIECAVIDLRSALESLGQITGETVSDEIIREIFARFCLGK